MRKLLFHKTYGELAVRNCGRSSSVEHQLPKLDRRVQFPSPAFIFLMLFLSGCASAPAYIKPVAQIPLDMPGVYHKVEKGETLWRISRYYGVDLDQITKINNIADNSVIEVGQKVFIPGVAKAPAYTVAYPQGEDFIWPVKGRIEVGLGQKHDNMINRGINIRPFSVSDVVASRSGRVVFVNNNFAGLGKTVIIEHKDSYFTVYSQTSEVFVKPGDIVRQGAPIARLSPSRDTGKGYLQFQVRKGHVPKNPVFYLP